MESNTSGVYKAYTKNIILWGRIFMLLGLMASLLPGIYLAVVYQIVPPWDKVLQGMALMVPFLLGGWFVEPIAFFPVLGISGTYLSWLTGNIANIRIPVSIMAQETGEVQESTPEGDILSTLGIGISVLVTLVILAVGAFMGTSVISMLPEIIQKALSYLLPATFGAIFAGFTMRAPALGLIAFVMAVVTIVLGLPSWLRMLIVVFGSIIIAFTMQSHKSKKQASASASK
ncbi:MAG: hypothetical protein LBN26_03835 [Christensenellaceae bacterium]|jgi:hypothetical protein|nr:hypothetical protein [Christensenellaceae bacterium]